MKTISELFQLAVQLHQANRLVQAEQVYRELLEIQPNHSEGLYALGILMRQLGKYESAKELFNSVLRLKPESAKVWFSLGNLHQEQGQLSEAVESYQQALAIEPKSVPFLNNLGYTLQQQGKFSEAIACYQKVLELESDCLEAKVNLGNTLFAMGKLAPSEYAFYASLNNQLGVSHQQAGELKTALNCYRQAIALQPDLTEAHYNLGMALQEQGKFSEAIALYQKVLELDPSKVEVYYKFGKIYQAQHKLEEAAVAFGQWLTPINPHYAEAVAAYQESKIIPEEQTPPELFLGEVIIGGHKFPAIPPAIVSDERPFWSVIIPLYNRTDYLLECLASVLSQWQGKQDMEIIIMDNASTPPLFELVNALAKGIVRYYRNRENIGARRNFNLGIALSCGKWIHVLPEDEYVLPGFYDRFRQSLEQCSDSVGAAFTGYENINEQEQVIFSQQVYGDFRGIAPDWLEKIGISNLLNPCAVVIRRETHEWLGAYDPDNTYTPDWELYKRIACFYDWWYEPGILARYRQHSHNMTAELLLAGAQASSIRQGIEIAEDYLPVEQCAEITAKARSHYFDYCLEHALIPLRADNLSGALRLLQEALKIDGSAAAVDKLFAWLTSEETAPIRNELVSKLMAISLQNSDEDSFYFAYP